MWYGLLISTWIMCTTAIDRRKIAQSSAPPFTATQWGWLDYIPYYIAGWPNGGKTKKIIEIDRTTPVSEGKAIPPARSFSRTARNLKKNRDAWKKKKKKKIIFWNALQNERVNLRPVAERDTHTHTHSETRITLKNNGWLHALRNDSRDIFGIIFEGRTDIRDWSSTHINIKRHTTTHTGRQAASIKDYSKKKANNFFGCVYILRNHPALTLCQGQKTRIVFSTRNAHHRRRQGVVEIFGDSGLWCQSLSCSHSPLYGAHFVLSFALFIICLLN